MTLADIDDSKVVKEFFGIFKGNPEHMPIS